MISEPSGSFMKCRHCKQKLNLFKSLSGSSFCSPEHQKLYEEAEANKGFERLLQFVERDAKPTSPAKPTVPPSAPPAPTPAANVEAKAAPPVVVPESQTIPTKPEKMEKAPDAASEPPMGGFLLQPASPAVSASSRLNARFEVPEAGFPAAPPALPSFKFEIASEDLQKQAEGAPPPLATWSNVSPKGTDSSKAVIEVASVTSVRPRAIDLAVPSPERHVLTAGGLPGQSFSDSRALRISAKAVVEVAGVSSVRARAIDLAVPSPESRVPAAGGLPGQPFGDSPALRASIQAVIDIQEFAPLAQLNVLPAAPRTANETVHGASPKLGVPALSQPDVVVLSTPSPAQDSREVSVGMSGAMTRTGVGRKISPPAVHRPAAPSSLTVLPSRALLKLNLRPAGQSASIVMNDAMTRAGVAKAVRQPAVASSRFLNTLGSNQSLNPLSAGLQNSARPRGCSTLPPRPAHAECVAPECRSSMREFAAGIPAVIAHRKLIIRETDAAVARGITEVVKPAAVSSALFIPTAPGFRPSIKVGVERGVREIPVNVQSKDGSGRCAISAARTTLRDCLRPVFLWSAKAWLGSAAASVGWFHETDFAAEAIASGTPAARHFAVRFAPESSYIDVPVLTRDRISRQLALAVCEWKAEAQRLARSQPSRTSPLSLVARPQTGATTLAARQVAKLNRFGSIRNLANGGAVTSALAPASVDEHKSAISLPQLDGAGLVFASRLSSSASLKSPSLQPTQSENPEPSSSPQPSPLRVQPASMLVLPGSSITSRRIRWVASGGWATVASPNLPQQQHAPVSSSEQTLSSLRCLADAVGMDRAEMRESAALRLNPKRPVIALDFGAQTSAPGVPPANALPRRSGPQLPVVKAKLDGLSTALL
jgi:hypothetical protein